MVGKLKNHRKDLFLQIQNDKPSIASDQNTLACRMKFNFSYLQQDQKYCGQIDDNVLAVEIMRKLVDYSAQSLDYWQKQRIGSGRQTVLEVYPHFPNHSQFIEPKSIPHQAQWSRFRLDQHKRLIGFVLPKEYDNQRHSSGYTFDCNTFYVVFFDPYHQFYPVKKK